MILLYHFCYFVVDFYFFKERRLFVILVFMLTRLVIGIRTAFLGLVLVLTPLLEIGRLSPFGACLRHTPKRPLVSSVGQVGRALP